MNASVGTSPCFDPALNRARHALYRFLSIGFLDPRAEMWQELADPVLLDSVRAAAELIREESLAEAAELGSGERPLNQLDPAEVLAQVPSTENELNAEFERTFGLLVSGNCPPYATEYIDGKFTFQRSHHLADIAGFYRAFGLEVSATWPDRQDHLTLQLEFMSVLIGLEQAANVESTEGLERMEVCRAAQRQFFGDHLAWWVPTFAKLLCNANPGGFYAELGLFLTAFIPAERSLLGISPVHGRFKPSLSHSPEDCEGCGLQL